MNRFFSVILSVLLLVALNSCNNGEGEGGTGIIEGDVMLVLHPDDNYNLETDTTVAAKVDVFIVYGDDTFYGDDVETDDNGHYRFKYMNPGKYTLFAYSTLPSGERIAVSQEVELKKGATATVPTIYIHEGKAYGTSIVKGRVYARYYHNSTYRGEGWAYDHRVFIKRDSEPYHFDDVRVGIDGYFYFQKITPGDYTIFTFTENLNEIPDTVTRSIKVENAGTIYEISDTINIISNV